MTKDELGQWFRESSEVLRLLAVEYHRLLLIEATFGLDKRQARRVRRRMGRPGRPDLPGQTVEPRA